LFFGTQNYVRDIYSGNRASLPGYLVGWLLCGYSWGILTVPALRFMRRFSLSALDWSHFLLVHLPAGVLFAAVQLGIYTLIASVLALISGSEGRSLAEFYSRLFVQEFQSSYLVYLAIIATVTAYDRVFRYQEPQTEPKLAEAPNGNGDGKGYLKRIPVKDNGRIVLVDISDIDWIESYGNYLFLHTGDKRHIFRETMAAMEHKLDPEQFARVRRSAIVRVDRIEELRPYQNGEYAIVLRGGTRLSSTRRYRKNIESVIRS
jgi:DNA-binding LytR/AlgR family response regulator